MAWTGLTLTVDGRNALNQAQMNNRLCFKAIVIGDGNPPGNFGTQKSLVHPLYELSDLKVDMTDEGCALTADFPAVDDDYYFREIGVIVATEDGDKLYVYDNCGDDAQYIVSTTGAERTQKRIRLYLTISDVADVAVSAPAILYVDYDEYEKDIEELNQKIDVLGTNDISGIGDGSVTGAITALKSVAFSGSYNDLSDKPPIPVAVAVKGNAEAAYRTGNVNLTPANIGLGNVANERQYSASNPQPSVAGSSGSCTGNAATATALTTNAGSAAQPVYFSGGKPVACTAYASASVNYANSAGTAATATKATQDGNGRNIAATYFPKTGGALNGHIDMENNKHIKMKDTSGVLIELLGVNTANNIHMGDYNGLNISPTFLHAQGSQYDFYGGSFHPASSNARTLGDASHLWKTVYAKTGTINTSDRTKKHDICDISEVYEQLFLKLQPKSFVFKDGDRVHIGAISQDVEEAMTELGIEPEQFAGFCKDVRYEYKEFNKEDGTPVESSKIPCTDAEGNFIYDYSLRYQEFIFLTVHMTKRLWERMDSLETENEVWKEKLNNLEAKIEELLEKAN